MAFISGPFKIDDRNLDCNIWHKQHIIRHCSCWAHKEISTHHHTRKEERENDSDVATGMNYGFASFSSWSKSICNTEMDITYKN